jgi:hypothetical protein
VSRENSGAGFFTGLGVGDISIPIENMEITAGANIEGFENEMIFILFVRDGVIRTLEGATIADSTVGIDFSQVHFAVNQDQTVWISPRAI